MKTSRRQVVGGSLAALVAGACFGKLHGLAQHLQGASANAQSLITEPVHVPQDFAGLHAHRWPVGTPASAKPTYHFGTARSHDFEGAAWSRVHKAPDVYDWEKLDAWVKVHTEAGRSLIYTLYGTPAWASQLPEQRDPYGERGGAAPPRDLRAVADFVRTLVRRYNSDGEHRIAYLELWNEPTFDRSPGHFWCGTAEELVALGRTAALTAKAEDPRICVLSPGFAGNLAGALDLFAPRLQDAESSPIYQYLTAADGHGAHGARWCDGIAFHCYNAPTTGTNRYFAQEIVRVKAMLHLLGITAPLYDTEFGFLPEDEFHEASRIAQAMVLRRCAAVQAGLGVRALCFYAHDDELVGNPSLHPEVAEAIGDVHAMIAGKTLDQVTLQPDGSVRIRTSERILKW